MARAERKALAMTEHISDFCERKARAGDSGFAVAFALLEVAAAITKAANCEAQRTDHPLMGETLGGIEGALSQIANAIGDHP